MIMILLVTAYNGMWEQGRRDGYTKGYTQSYSKYPRRPRVRTASDGILIAFPVVVRLVQHRLAAARSTHLRKQQVIAPAIIE